MIAVLQRVKKANVSVSSKIVGSCDQGICILLGVAQDDEESDAVALAEKIINLRIFSDENGKMNLSLKDIDGEVLIISNFTLLAAYRKGNRPDYMSAASPMEADRLYTFFANILKERLKRAECGIFGADMELNITNDGPVTIVMDSKVLLAPKNKVKA